MFMCTFNSLLFSSLHSLIFWKSYLHSHSIYIYTWTHALWPVTVSRLIKPYIMHSVRSWKFLSIFGRNCNFYVSSPAYINPQHYLRTFFIHYDYFNNEKYFIASLLLPLSLLLCIFVYCSSPKCSLAFTRFLALSANFAINCFIILNKIFRRMCIS